MAIVKATSYTRDPAGAKASIRYIQQRPGKEKAKITRSLFGLDGLMERSHAYRLIDQAADGSYFYRFVISPDPESEDTNRDLHLREITEKTMQTLSKRLYTPLAWVAAEHDDHEPHRHMHIVAVVERRLNPRDFLTLRQTATHAAVSQRQQRDFAQTRTRQRLYQFPTYRKDTVARDRQMSHGSPGRSYQTSCTCPRCHASQEHQVPHKVHQCDSCGFILHRGKQLRLQQRKEVGWERSR